MVFSGCSVVALVTACKPKTEDGASNDGGRTQFNRFFATSETEVRNKNTIFFSLFKKDYDTKFNQSLSEGSVDPAKVPYTGSYYLSLEGGTGRDNGHGNPLATYDKVFYGGVDTAAKWERENHTVAASAPEASWDGHCNGFSASAQRHSEPKHEVKRGTETFTPRDIKALLAEIHMSAKFYFLGGNRCALLNSTPLTLPNYRSDEQVLGDCDDVNAGTFHITVTNWIGIQKHTVIMDQSAKEQVWNYPHFKYKFSAPEVSASEAMRLVTGQTSSTYKFNPSAKKFLHVSMDITHAKAWKEERLTSEFVVGDRTATKTYTYVLELDENQRILGGEWTGNSQQDHPDFIWVAFEPAGGDGGRRGANPKVDPKEVIKLWAESIDADPNNPPLDILDPQISFNWGQFQKFEVSANGSRGGTVFSGRSTTLIFKRRELLTGDVTLDVALDSTAKPAVSGSGDADIKVDLGPVPPGIHIVDVVWKKGGTEADRQRLWLHSI